MRVRSLTFIGIAAGLLVAAPSAAVSYGFGCITSNTPGDCTIAEAQILVDVTDEGGGDVRFTFTNVGADASSIEGIYFDDGSLLGISSIVNGPGVSFTGGSASPPNLPAANLASPPFVTTSGFLADSDPPTSGNGVQPGEFVAIIFDLQGGQTFADVISELDAATLRVGIHVIAFASGGSESLVNVVPEPALGALLLVGIAVACVRRQRR